MDSGKIENDRHEERRETRSGTLGSTGPTGSAARLVPAECRPIIPLLSYQRADIESRARLSWCCWSRQTGKSFTKSLKRLLRGVIRRRNQILLSAGERQSAELMLKVRQHCRALNIACSYQGDRFFEGTRFRELTMELANGVRVIGLPANPMTARGFTGDVLLDEFAMHRDDRAIWASIFPTILRGGGELDVASTPRGRDNLFAELRTNERFARSVVTLHDAVAAGLEVDPEEIRRSMSDDELFRQEFLCEFLDGSSVLLSHELIAAVEDASLSKDVDVTWQRRRNGPLSVGVDIGRCRDLTVMWVLEREGEVLVTRGVRESVGEPFRDQYRALRELLSLREVARCCIDAGGIGMALAEAAVDEFGGSRVEPVTFTGAIKDELANRLRLRVEERTIRIPADEAIRNDWHSVRRSVTTAGPSRYEASRSGGGHADRFWAACLAVRAAGQSAGVIEHLRGPSLRFGREGIW